MRTVGIVTGNRADYGLSLPIIKRIQQEKGLRCLVYATGSHYSRAHGSTIKEFNRDKVKISANNPINISSDSPAGILRAMASCLNGFSKIFARLKPDILLVVGDRFEMYAAALASLPFNIPLAHVYGGEITEGAIDNHLRHSITKMGHLHFTSTKEYAQRVIQLGEENWRVKVTGAPGLDPIRHMNFMSVESLMKICRLRTKTPPILVTFHPVTMQLSKTENQIIELLQALRKFDRPIVFTAPNNDAHGRKIRIAIKGFVKKYPQSRLINNFGTRAYFSMMKWASVNVGNSSSGIMEAPSFKLPVVNVGIRQQGRIKEKNVIDVKCRRNEIYKGIKKALRADFKNSLKDLTNPYGDGRASARIVDRLKKVPLNERLLIKRFMDLEFSGKTSG